MRLRTQDRYTNRESVDEVTSLVEGACECSTIYATGVTNQDCTKATLARLVEVLAERGLLTGPDIVRIVGGLQDVYEDTAEVLR